MAYQRIYFTRPYVGTRSKLFGRLTLSEGTIVASGSMKDDKIIERLVDCWNANVDRFNPADVLNYAPHSSLKLVARRLARLPVNKWPAKDCRAILGYVIFMATKG